MLTCNGEEYTRGQIHDDNPGACAARDHRRTRLRLIIPATLLAPIASPLTVSRALNSLFKVLFIFPSQYLFAIGLVPIFSFRWNLPPILGCIPKQPDSLKDLRIGMCCAVKYGILTLFDALFQGT